MTEQPTAAEEDLIIKVPMYRKTHEDYIPNLTSKALSQRLKASSSWLMPWPGKYQARAQ